MPVETRRGEVVEVLHGREIADPYRWLEDPDSPETTAWVAAQNEQTRAHLDQAPGHDWFTDVMRRIVLRPQATAPLYESGWYLVSRNDGTQAQNTWYAARSVDELVEGGRVLFDPSSWSEDGTTSLSGFSFNPSGTRVAWSRSEGGSDWQIVSVTDPATGEILESDVLTTKFSSLVWIDDDTFCHTLYEDRRADGTDTAALPAPILRLHTVGTPVSTDRTIWEHPDDPQVSAWPQRSSDGRWLAVASHRGTDRRYRLWLHRIENGTLGEAVHVLEEFRDDIDVVDVIDDTLYLLTDAGAPRRRIVTLDLGGLTPGTPVPESAWRTVVPESDDTLTHAVVAGDSLVTEHLADAAPVLTLHRLDGTPTGRLPIQGGTLVALSGEAGHDELLVTVNSITAPVQSFVVTPSTGEQREVSFAPEGTWTPPRITVTRHRATSVDGTAVPYWLARRADLPADAPTPTLMYGYGGFNVALGATFIPIHSAWIEAGGAAVITNLRGGGEFGTAWYEAGKRDNKQNVFDDFAAVARDLVDRGVTTPQQLAAWGGSNGGLLVGALITQHPELVAAAIPMVGVLDMLRFHKFTIGAAWISDYGDPDVAADFETALAYSPLHNVHDGTAYPATLVVTGDHDDRVVPAHSHKFTATLQHAQGGDAPILTRIETSTGHGAGKPKAVLVAEAADVLTFLARHTGLTPETAP